MSVEELAKGYGSAEVRECPFPFFAALREHAPVYRVPEREIYFVSRWEDIAYVAEHPELFAAGSRRGDTIFRRQGMARAHDTNGEAEDGFSATPLASCDGVDHRAKRSAALSLVSPARLRRIHPFVVATANELVDRFIERGQVELGAEFALQLPMLVICELLGLPAEDHALFARLGQQASASASAFLGQDELVERAALGGEATEYMRATLSDRIDHPGEDFLSEFIRDHVERFGELHLDYLVPEATTLLFGGLVTTHHMIVNTAYLLALYPEVLERVASDRAQIRPLIDESLRLETPFHLTELTCLRDTEIAGVEIPAGAAVYKLWASGNRDERVFDDPDEFRLGRPGIAKTHLGFGRGPHRCLGAALALLEGTVAFDVLLARLHNLRFTPDANTFTHVRTVGFHALRELHLDFDVH